MGHADVEVVGLIVVLEVVGLMVDRAVVGLIVVLAVVGLMVDLAVVRMVVTGLHFPVSQLHPAGHSVLVVRVTPLLVSVIT